MALARKFALVALLLILSSGICLSEENYPFQGQICEDNINVRADSTVSAQPICALNKGDKVEVISGSYDWYKIRLPQKAPSYIKETLLECIAYKTNSTECQTAKATKERINIRLQPNEHSPILGKIDKDQIVTVVESKTGWCKINPIPESFGWIHKKFINKATPAEAKKEERQVIPREPNDTSIKQASATNYIMLEGVINPYGKVFKRLATHKVITGDNKIFLLKGDKKSLDKLNGRKIKVTGRIIQAPSEKYPVIEINTIEALD